MFSCPYGPGVYYVTDKDASVSNLARMGLAQKDLDCRFHEDVTAYDGQGNALDDIGGVLDAAVNPFLSALADAVYAVILKPVDV